MDNEKPKTIEEQLKEQRLFGEELQRDLGETNKKIEELEKPEEIEPFKDVPMDAQGRKIKHVATPAEDKDAANKGYVDVLDDANVKLTGNQTIAGVKTFSSFPITPSAAPTTDYQMSNKKYVDDNIGLSSKARAYLGSAETITTTVGKIVEFGAETYDIDSEFDTANHKFTATKAGYYLVHSRVRLADNGYSFSWGMRIKLNGSTNISTRQFPKTSGYAQDFEITDVIHLNATDYIEIWVEQVGGVNGSLLTGEAITFVSIHRLS